MKTPLLLLALLPAPFARAESMRVSVTQFCSHCAKCGTSGVTRTGTRARPRVIPLGSLVRVPGFGLLRAEDTGGKVIGRTVDVCIGRGPHSKAKRWGRRWMTVRIVRRGRGRR